MKYAATLLACALLGFSLHAIVFTPVVTGVSVVYIHSKNKAKMTKWYQETLNLEPGWNTDDWTSFDFANGTRFALDHVSDKPNEVQKQSIVINFDVPDIKKAIEELSAKGVQFYALEGETVFDVGTSLVAHFRDPDGNFVSISERKK